MKKIKKILDKIEKICYNIYQMGEGKIMKRGQIK